MLSSNLNLQSLQEHPGLNQFTLGWVRLQQFRLGFGPN
jgi:hypothetical protein